MGHIKLDAHMRLFVYPRSYSTLYFTLDLNTSSTKSLK